MILFRDVFHYAEPEPNSGCWIWTSNRTPNGYGLYVRRGGRGDDGRRLFQRELAHRVVYRAFRGEIPTDLVIDHLCRIKSCVNPNHLRVTTQQINVASARPDTAPCGHKYDSTDGAARRCRACRNARHLRLYRAGRFARKPKVIIALEIRSVEEAAHALQ